MTRSMRRTPWATVLALSALAAHPVLAQQTATSTAPAPFRWPKSLAEIRESDKLPAATIAGFVNAARPGSLAVPIEVKTFRFVPMEGENVSLAVDADNSKSTSLFGLAVVCPNPGTGSAQITVLHSDALSLEGGELVDLNGDGDFEIVTGELVGGYLGANTIPLAWYTVYQVKEGVPRDVSAGHRNFYLKRLFPELAVASRLLEATCKEPGSSAELIQAGVQFLTAKYHRKILGEPGAGFDDAVRWSQSDNFQLQTLACQSFLEIDSPQALVELKKLTGSKSPGLAGCAADAIQTKSQGYR